MLRTRWPEDFKPKEFLKSGGNPQEVPTLAQGRIWVNLFALAHELQKVRDVTGKLIIISGYRHPKYNAALRMAGHNVAKNSRHMAGQAADVKSYYMPPAELHAEFKRLIELGIIHDGGLGLYRAFVHYDIGPSRRW
jgi:uncharacterized protein YcbK (DUF882 family)